MPMPLTWMLSLLVLLVLSVSATAQTQQDRQYCGDEGVWFQILGSGDLDIGHNRAAGSYIVWLDHQARVLVDAGSGTVIRFDESGASFADLHAIVLTQNTVEHSGDLVDLLVASSRSERETTLRIFGPEGNKQYNSTSQMFERLTGAEGAFPQWQRLPYHDSPLGHRVRVTDVPSIGRKRWSAFGTELIQLHAIPVSHGDVPAVAWRIDVGGHRLVFANDFNNRKDLVADFAKDADILVFSHHIPEGIVGELREQYVSPTQIGRIAERAGVRFVVLGSRSWGTFAREQRSMSAIEEHFDGVQIYANELECWGL